MAQDHRLVDDVVPNAAGHHVMNLYTRTRRLIRAHIALRGHARPNHRYLHRRRSGVAMRARITGSRTRLLHFDEDLVIGDYRMDFM